MGLFFSKNNNFEKMLEMESKISNMEIKIEKSKEFHNSFFSNFIFFSFIIEIFLILISIYKSFSSNTMFENSWCYLLCILFSILFYIVSTLYRFFSGSLIRFYENKLNNLIIGFEKILNDIKVETDFETILKYENILKKKKCNNRVQQENLKPQQLQQPQQPGKSQKTQQPEKPQIINQNVQKLQKTPQNSKNKWWFDQIIEFLISFGSTSKSPLVCKNCGSFNGYVPGAKVSGIKFLCIECHFFNSYSLNNINEKWFGKLIDFLKFR
ncbi:hypothetical protein DICPUDRAFT_82387 [Dictyostelium purpureum]|uniref:Endoplasmic reticulum junction formation protein lunapark n=1 Tax=Dictyostelium purpureum TaxID=5786 RepID=F0ZWD2_DICPU|nr:uncharacterized protein DICPUDRAFT_82387 [Dictyostelium purpureum]EGC31751.1 hypothetical protein DICPUDRAFT_82387 [Dictyostelium purpureum]|eukprot:XP_003291731.1 hypothetical protein DICPUDRAFT_82387 [Dictyostelium purpureum]